METAIRVLVADDTVTAREGWKTILKTDPGIEVAAEATSTLEAINKLKALDPDIILMDLKWGADKTAGWTAIREMKKLGQRAKIIAITAYDELIADARRAGADAALTKEFSREELLKLIHELHESSFDLRPNHEPTNPQVALTSRELEVLCLVADGLSDRKIAERLYITESTAKNHVRSILDKLSAENRTQAVKIAREHGILN